MMKIRRLSLIAMLFAVQGHAQAQSEVMRLRIEQSCSYSGAATVGDIYGFASSQTAEDAVEAILRHTGLPKNFRIKSANVSNAEAVIMRSAQGQAERWILYSETFMHRIKQQTQTDWAAASILAHEIGHHLSGHTLGSEGSRPETELQADGFSGFVLHRMGATLDEAQAAMNVVAVETASKTHPPKTARLAAIASGWTQAKDQSQGAGPPRPDKEPKRESGGNAGPPPAPPSATQTPPSQPAPSNVVATCTFADGGIAFVLSDHRIVARMSGMEIPVAVRAPSPDPRLSWIYETNGDPSMELLMQQYGLSTKVRYGVGWDGVVYAITGAAIGRCS